MTTLREWNHAQAWLRWRQSQKHMEIIARSLTCRGSNDEKLAKAIGYEGATKVVRSIREALLAAVPEFTTHDSMGWWFMWAARAAGWDATPRFNVPLETRTSIGRPRRYILDLIVTEPPSTSSGRPRYVIEFKQTIPNPSSLKAGIRQVTRYCDVLDAEWPDADIEAVLCAPSIAAPGARGYGRVRGVTVCDTAELALLFRSRGWLDLEAAS